MGEQVAAGLKRKKSESFLNRGESQWGCSSVGRAPALQAGGHEFESHHLHASNKPCKIRKTGASRDEIDAKHL